jgi:LPXTG-motif cell wall-anchored protein
MKTVFHKIGATLGLAAITGLGVALPASAATFAEWGEWVDGAEDRLVFSDPSFSGATFSVDNEQTWRTEATADGFWVGSFTADSPVGSLIGANVSSTKDLALYLETKDDNNEAVVAVITFDTEVPAGTLVFALSDVDTDDAYIEMANGVGDPLTGSEIIGTATNTGFNSADPTSTDRPTVVAGSNFVTIGDAPDETLGSTGWLRPSAAVKTIAIVINCEDNYYQGQRIWIGQIGGSEDVGGSSDEGLAKTGATDSMYLVAFAGAAILAAAGIVRRRTN